MATITFPTADGVETDSSSVALTWALIGTGGTQVSYRVVVTSTYGTHVDTGVVTSATLGYTVTGLASDVSYTAAVTVVQSNDVTYTQHFTSTADGWASADSVQQISTYLAVWRSGAVPSVYSQDFEALTSFLHEPDGWANSGGGMCYVTDITDGYYYHSYQKCLRFDVDSGGAGRMSRTFTGLTIGTSYRFSVWLRTPASTTFYLGMDSETATPSACPAVDTYFQATRTFTASATSHVLWFSVGLSVGISGSRVAFADDILLAQGSDVLSEPPVTAYKSLTTVVGASYLLTAHGRAASADTINGVQVGVTGIGSGDLVPVSGLSIGTATYTFTAVSTSSQVTVSFTSVAGTYPDGMLDDITLRLSPAPTYRTWLSAYSQPMAPTLSYTQDAYSVTVNVTNPTPSGSRPVAAGNWVYKYVDGAFEFVGWAAPNGDLVDYLVRSGASVTYEVLAYAAAGALSNPVDLAATAPLVQGICLFLRSDPADSLMSFPYAAGSTSETSKATSVTTQALTSMYPRFDTSGSAQGTLGLSIDLPWTATYQSTLTLLREVIRLRTPMSYKDSRGRLLKGYLAGVTESDTDSGTKITGTFVIQGEGDINEVV